MIRKIHNHPRIVTNWGNHKSDTMAKVQHFSGISKRIPFEGFDFYDLFRVTFENSELGRMKRLLPLHEMAVNFGLVGNHPVRKRGRKSFFSPEGKVALMFLKMYTQLSAPKLMDQLNGNVHYQIFCDVYVASGKKQLKLVVWSVKIPS